MSRRSRKKRTKFSTIFTSILVILLIGGVTFYCLYTFLNPTRPTSNTAKNTTTPTVITESEEEKKETTQTTESVIDPETNKEDGIEVIDESSPNTSASVTGSITRASKTSKGTFRITATTDQALSEGTCSLSMTRDGVIVSASAEITAHPNAAACTFDIDQSKLTSGEWYVMVEISTTEDRTGVIEKLVEVSE